MDGSDKPVTKVVAEVGKTLAANKELFANATPKKAEIVIEGIEGISVPKKALRVLNGVEGVYILVGDVVRFRSVERIAEKGEYYIVKLKSNAAVFEDEKGEEVEIKPLSLYDNIIVSGKELFDGKIIG